MAYNLIISENANKDIIEIVEYITHNLKNEQAAADFLDDLERSYHLAEENPYIYSLCNDVRLRAEGYRRITIKHYLIFYRVIEEAETVFIARVVYGARDYGKLL